jgi:hypothetical protein
MPDALMAALRRDLDGGHGEASQAVDGMRVDCWRALCSCRARQQPARIGALPVP